MAAGGSADERLVKQLQKACELSGSDDKMIMDSHSSRNIRKFFWEEISEFNGLNLKTCEEKAFKSLKNKKNNTIQVDGPHVERYLFNTAYEITKAKKRDPHMKQSDPRITVTKNFLEKIVRETKIYITGKVEYIDPMDIDEPTRTSANKKFHFLRPEYPRTMKQVYDLRKSQPIVIAKRDYGNLS